MADLKISQLSDGGASQATDEYVVARSGANYRIDGASVAAAATSVGTLTSLTVSGNANFDSGTLFVDSAANRVGVGTASPSSPLTVQADASALGIHLIGRSAGQEEAWFRFYKNNGSTVNCGILGSNQGLTFGMGSGLTEIAKFDTSGNLGLGVTPRAWQTSPVWRALDFGSAIAAIGTSEAYFNIACNAYRNTSNQWIRNSTNAVAIYGMDEGAHTWGSASSGTAGTAATVTTKMTLDASGNLGIGVTPSATDRIYVRTAAVTDSAYYADNSVDSGFRVKFASNLTSILNDFNNPLAFGTNNTERARITSGGYFKASDAGTYESSTGAYHEMRSSTADWTTIVGNTSASSPNGIYVKYTAAAPNGTSNHFLYCADNSAGALRAAIRSNGGLENYSANNVNIASDERLKKDIAPLASTWDKLKAIEVVNFRYKDCNEGDPALYGVIAQQVQPIVPQLVVVSRPAVEAKDAVLDENGNEVTPAVEAAPEYYGIREQPMYWLAIKALQEAQARIEALEASNAGLLARLEALEA